MLLLRQLLPVSLLRWGACWTVAARTQVEGCMDWVGGTRHLLPAAAWWQLWLSWRLLCLPLPPIGRSAQRWWRLRSCCCWVRALHR